MPVLASTTSGARSWLQRRLLWSAGIVNLLLWVYLALAVSPTADPVALHATIYFEIDRVGEWYRLFLIPGAGLIILGLNGSLPALLRLRAVLPGELLAGMALVCQGILWLAALTIV